MLTKLIDVILVVFLPLMSSFGRVHAFYGRGPCTFRGITVNKSNYAQPENCGETWKCFDGVMAKTRHRPCPRYSYCDTTALICKCLNRDGVSIHRPNNLLAVCPIYSANMANNTSSTLPPTTNSQNTTKAAASMTRNSTTHVTTTPRQQPSATTSANTAIMPPSACPDDSWKLVSGDRCLKVYNQRMTFDNARTECMTTNGDLVKILNAGQNSEVKGLLLRRARYWIGIRQDMHGDGSFKYLSGQPLTSFRPWHYGEPNNHRGNEKCVEIIGNKRGTWNDKRCGKKRGFVCEIQNKR